jgi:starch phosphorylase
LTEDQVEAMSHHYNPNSIIDNDDDLGRVMKLLECGHFNQFEPGLFDNVIASIRSPNDPWMTAADFRSFIDAQKRVEAAYQDQEHWTKMSILNCAASSKFSTDRTIAEYNNEIWNLAAIDIDNKY